MTPNLFHAPTYSIEEQDEVLSDVAAWDAIDEQLAAHDKATSVAVQPSNEPDDRISSRRLNEKLAAERRRALHVKRRHSARGEA